MVKRLAKSIREYKKPSLLAPLFVSLEVILEVIVPFLLADLIDLGIDKGDMGYVLKLGAVLAVMYLLSLLCGALSGKYAAEASAGFAKNLRRDIFHKVQDFSFANIDKFSTSGLVTRLTTDVTNLQNAYQMIIRIAVRAPFMLIAALAMTFAVNGEVSLVFLGVIPVLAIGLALIMKNAHPIFERMFKAYDRLNSVIQENLHGIRVVKSYVREDHEKEKFSEVSGKIYDLSSKAEKLLAWTSPLMQSCVYTCMLLISWFGANLIVSGDMTTGELMSMFTYVMQILGSLMMLSMIFVMVTMSRASGERISEVLNETIDLVNPANPVTKVEDGSIVFDNVSFSYSKSMEKLALAHVNFEIRSGETIGIIGGTGSSKSTLVQLIPRLYDVTEGCVKVGGRDVRDYDIKSLRDEVAMVLQKNVLFSGTIKDNLRWGNENASDEELERVCRLAQADSFIQEMPDKYDTYIEQGGTNVSGGQKQRLCIARALLKKPKILILDDSTSAVDTRTDALIRKAFAEEIPETTKLIIAQRITSVQDADKIIVLDEGEVKDIGSHKELLEHNPVYREIYTSQVKGGMMNE